MHDAARVVCAARETDEDLGRRAKGQGRAPLVVEQGDRSARAQRLELRVEEAAARGARGAEEQREARDDDVARLARGFFGLGLRASVDRAGRARRVLRIGRVLAVEDQIGGDVHEARADRGAPARDRRGRLHVHAPRAIGIARAVRDRADGGAVDHRAGRPGAERALDRARVLEVHAFAAHHVPPALERLAHPPAEQTGRAGEPDGARAQDALSTAWP